MVQDVVQVRHNIMITMMKMSIHPEPFKRIWKPFTSSYLNILHTLNNK